MQHQAWLILDFLIQFQMKAPVKLICYGCLKFATIIKCQHENPSLKDLLPQKWVRILEVQRFQLACKLVKCRSYMASSRIWIIYLIINHNKSVNVNPNISRWKMNCGDLRMVGSIPRELLPPSIALLYIMKAGARTSLNAFFPILYVVCIIGAPLFPNFVGKRGELCQYYCGLAFVRLVPNPRRKKILT